MLKWQAGRQMGSYAKMALIPEWLSKLFNFDAYILKFPDQCSVMKHRDPVQVGYNHYRLNVTIKRSDNFRDRMYILGPVKRWWRFEVFRPDLYDHGLRPITGSMYMLSVGYRVKSKPVDIIVG